MSSSKNILIIGGSGRTGKLVIADLLSRNHHVTALVRTPTSLSSLANPNLHIITGTPLNITDIRTAFTHSTPSIIIVTLSAPRASDSPFAAVTSPPRLMADSVSNIVSIMQDPSFSIHKPKIVIMQAFGVGKSWENMHCVMRMLMKGSNMIYQYDDHNAVARETEGSGVRYVFVRPARLVEGEVGGVRVWEDGKGVGVMACVKRGSVARFLVECCEGSEWDGKAPVITD